MASTTFSGPVTSTNGFIGNVTGTVTGNLFGTVGARSGAGAVPTTSNTVLLTTTGTNALTLADGVNGQTLRIVMVVDGGDGTLTPTTKTGYTTVTFTAVGNAVMLQFFTTQGWMVVSNYGATVA